MNHPSRLTNPDYRTTVSHTIVGDTKFCNGCKTMKSLTDFGKSTKSKCGFSYTCKKCFSFHAMFQGAKNRCKKEGRVPDFSLEDIKELAVTTCPVFGMELQFGGDVFKANSATVDAIVHAKGHVKGNLRIISARANTIKNNCTLEEMGQLVAALRAWRAPSVAEGPKRPRTRFAPMRGLEGKDEEEETKQCSGCQEAFPLRSYPKDASSRTGHGTRCTRCTAIKAMVQNAKKRVGDSLPFDIDFGYVRAIAPDVCPIFGTKLQYGNGVLCDSSASIDRFDPKRGYVKGNVWIVCDKANRMKSDATLEEIVAVHTYMGSC